MVIGLPKFKEWFADYADCYVIIGGTACDEQLSEAGFVPRATKDIDMVLIVEALTANFVERFWQFVKQGGYARCEQESERRNAYRFSKPTDSAFPKQVELFSRKADVLTLPADMHITPIPTEEGLSSLSAILLNDDYYHFTIQHSRLVDEVHIADVEALICLKAFAWLDNQARKQRGESVDAKNINKHKNDIFRLLPLLPANYSIMLPDSIHADMQLFAEQIKDNLPDAHTLHEYGFAELSPDFLYQTLLTAFGI